MDTSSLRYSSLRPIVFRGQFYHVSHTTLTGHYYIRLPDGRLVATTDRQENGITVAGPVGAIEGVFGRRNIVDATRVDVAPLLENNLPERSVLLLDVPTQADCGALVGTNLHAVVVLAPTAGDQYYRCHVSQFQQRTEPNAPGITYQGQTDSPRNATITLHYGPSGQILMIRVNSTAA